MILNQDAISRDLDNNWAVVAEAIQTILRSIGYPNPYEALKDLTRTNTHIGEAEIKAFVEQLNVPEDVKSRLRLISPSTYTGE